MGAELDAADLEAADAPGAHGGEKRPVPPSAVEDPVNYNKDRPDDVKDKDLPSEDAPDGGHWVAHNANGGRRLSKVDTAIDTIRKSWDDFGRKDAEMTFLTPSGEKAKISPFVPQDRGFRNGYRRGSASTLWDLKDARASLEYPESSSVGIKVYPRRWLMLAIYVLVGLTNTFQWVQYSIIANVVQRYYDVSSLAVDMTSMSYLIAYLIFFIPASWFLDKWGLRWSLIVSAGGTALGSWVKVASVARDRFWVTMVGQSIVAVAQVFMLFLAPKLSAVWFGPSQVSVACSIGFIGILAGNAVGLVLPPLLVPNTDNPTADLRAMFLGVAACTTATLVLQLALFQEQPPLPPSRAQQLQRRRTEEQNSQTSDREFWGALRRMLRCGQFQLLLVSWSLNVGVFCAVNTLLAQIVLPTKPDCEAQIGMVGLIMITSGIVGSVICGIFLDRTHRFKLTTMILYVFALAGWGIFAFQLEAEGFFWIYFTAAVYGFAMTAVQPVGMEFAAEITFPEPEGTATAVMCSLVQLSGLALTLAGGQLLETAGPRWAMVFLCAPLLLACVILAFMKPRMKRQEAQGANAVRLIPVN